MYTNWLKYFQAEANAQYLEIAENGFDPLTSGLWAQHASAAPLCYTPQLVASTQTARLQEN